MIDLQACSLGVLLPVRALAGARSSELRGEQGGALKVAVTQVAEKGKANKAIVALLSKQLKLRKSQIELLAGETAAEKRFLIREVSVQDLQQRIAAAMEASRS